MSNSKEQRIITLEYIYAKIKVSTRRCLSVFTSTEEKTNSSTYEYVQLDNYDDSYMGKYYINGGWYEDAEGTIPYEG